MLDHTRVSEMEAIGMQAELESELRWRLRVRRVSPDEQRLAGNCVDGRALWLQDG